MVQNPPQTAGNYVKELTQVEGGDQGIIDFEQHAQAVPLSRQLVLISSRSLEVQHIVHRDGHLARHLLHEIHFTAIVMVGFELPKAQRSQAALSSRQGNDTKGAHALLPKRLHKSWEGGLGFDVRDDEGILSLPNSS